MLLEAVFHRPTMPWAYARNEQAIHLLLRTKRDDVKRAFAVAGDKYAWDQTRQTLPMTKRFSDVLFDYWQVAVRPPFRRLRYGFMLRSGRETVWYGENGFSREPFADAHGLFEYPFLHPGDVFRPPEWAKEAVFYQIFPDRFANGDPSNDPPGTEPWGGQPTPRSFFGGDLAGIIDRLDYLAELGVNALYLTPIFEAPSNHKYDTKDYRKIDPHFGDAETLRRLVAACHERGIRVVLDAVFNHCGAEFAPFVDVLEKGRDSAYAGWFHVREWPPAVRDGIPTYDTFAFVPTMPKLNTEHPKVRDYLLGVAEYWIETADIDGWRLDVADEVDHRFWRDFRKTVKRAKPDAYIVGEIWHDASPWLQGDEFDAVMNYLFADAVLDFFAKERIDAKQFADAIGSLLARYPDPVTEVAFNLLGSHDTPRLLTMCGGDKRRMKLAVLFQLTFPGAPCIYYGDEIGMTGGGDPDCRRCMIWDADRQDRDLFAHYRTLIALRRANSALRTGDFRFLRARPGDRRLVYERKDENAHFVIFLNAGRRAANVSAAVPEGRWTDVWTGEAVEATGRRLTLRLPAYGFRMLKRDTP